MRIDNGRIIRSCLFPEIRYESDAYPSKACSVKVCVLGFASVREALSASQRALDLPDGARVRDAWNILEGLYPALASHRASVRFARNGRLVGADSALSEGDEIAILPPVGGG